MVATSHLAITLVEQAQAQKEVTVNAALTRIDAVLNTAALDKDLTSPPGSPVSGNLYIVASSATGDWSGHDGELAYFDQIWRFITPNEGMQVWLADEDLFYVYDGSTWVAMGGVTGEANIASNVGAGSGVFKQKSGIDLQFKSLVAGSGVSLSSAADTITISASGGGSGEVNTASNVGSGGVGLFKQKTGVNLEFKTLNAGSSKISVSDDTGGSEVDLDVVETNLTLSNLGGSLANGQISAGNITQHIDAIKPIESLLLAISDESTALTTGTAKLTFRMPYAFTLSAVRASLSTAPSGSTVIVDINESGTSILSTKLSIDAGEKTSTTAVSTAVISDSSLADDAEITIDIDQVGSSTAGTGLKVALIGKRA